MSSDKEENLEEDNNDQEIPEKITEEIDSMETELQENYTVLSRKVRIYIFSLFLILSVVVDLESVYLIHQ